MTITVDRDLERAFAQLYEVQKQLLGGALHPTQVRRPLQDILEHKFSADDRFNRYDGYLLSLEQQLGLLRDFNRRFWDNRLLAIELDSVDTSTDHTQRVDDLEVLYVDFGSPSDNVELWWKVLVGTQPNAKRWESMSNTDAEHLRLGASTACYEPGIHRIRINLVAHWEPEHGRTIDQVRAQASANGEILAHAEVMATYGLHSQLLGQQDGENLPYADLPGYEVTVPGRPAWQYVPYLLWGRSGRGVGLGAGWAASRDRYWAAPVLSES